MALSFTLKFTEKRETRTEAVKSFTLRFTVLRWEQEKKEVFGTWETIAGKIKYRKGLWEFAWGSNLWVFNDTDEHLSRYVGLGVSVNPHGSYEIFNIGTAYLQPKWAIGRDAGGTRAGDYTYRKL